MAVLNYILLAFGTLLAHHIYKIYSNYLVARQIGLPIIIAPLDGYSLLYQLCQRPITSFMRVLPFKTGTWWSRALDLTWSWESDGYAHSKLGKSFVMVSPARNLVFTSDEEAVSWVLKRWKEFPKPDVYESMEIFGRNVDTVNGEDWARHRKITAPCFNERISSFVWSESLLQARTMLAHWISQPSGFISNMVDDTRVVALHVLTAAGFGVSHNWHGGARVPAQGHKLSHRDALMGLFANFVMTIVLAKMPWLEKLGQWLPKKWADVYEAMHEFGQYMDEMLANERRIISNPASTVKQNLISTLIRTSDEAKQEGFGVGARLSDEEIKGNVFIFNLAGHDTTANTLAYATALLATHPEVQTWVAEEVDKVLGQQGDEEWIYEEMFPRLKRVLAVMLETLRLYGPVPTEPRQVAGTPAPFPISSPNSSSPKTITLPAKTNISLSIHACHMNPSLFPDPKAFKPSRWISAAEELLPHPLGFFPWSGGPRICPGMKFAQVEFVAVMATVLQGAKLFPAIKGGDPDVPFATMRDEVLRQLRKSDADGATLSLTSPEELWIKVEKR